MSFYITLPSNASMDLYTSNTISNFTTELYRPIQFDRPYEVALVEITYDHCWDVDLGKVCYHMPERQQIVEAEAILQDGEHFNTFLSRINAKLKEKLLELIQPQNNDFLVFKKNRMHVQTMVDEHFISFSGTIAQILGLDNNTQLKKTSPPIDVELYKEQFFFITSLYIYSDIIKYQFVGDSFAPLLRNVVVPNSARTTQNIIYSEPHYLPLNKSILNNINIRITDETGSFIKFKRGKSILKLHFRPSNGF